MVIFTGLPGMLNAYNAGEYGTANGGAAGHTRRSPASRRSIRVRGMI